MIYGVWNTTRNWDMKKFNVCNKLQIVNSVADTSWQMESWSKCHYRWRRWATNRKYIKRIHDNDLSFMPDLFFITKKIGMNPYMIAIHVFYVRLWILLFSFSDFLFVEIVSCSCIRSGLSWLFCIWDPKGRLPFCIKSFNL